MNHGSSHMAQLVLFLEVMRFKSQAPEKRRFPSSRPHWPCGYDSLVCSFTSTPQPPVREQNKAYPFLCLWPHASDRMYSIHSFTRYSASIHGTCCMLSPEGNGSGGTEVKPRRPYPWGLTVNQGRDIPESLHLLCHLSVCDYDSVCVCTCVCILDRKGFAGKGRP